MKIKENIEKILTIFCVIAILICPVIWTLATIYQISTVPTGSMLPTIQLNEKLLIKKLKNPEEVKKTLKRGDIVTFYSKETDTDLVKRLIGMPYDVVDIRDGSIYINGEYLEENYVQKQSNDNYTFYVPDGAYLFLGDNREESYDARLWKQPFISADDITGVVVYHLYPVLKNID